MDTMTSTKLPGSAVFGRPTFSPEEELALRREALKHAMETRGSAASEREVLRIAEAYYRFMIGVVAVAPSSDA